MVKSAGEKRRVLEIKRQVCGGGGVGVCKRRKLLRIKQRKSEPKRRLSIVKDSHTKEELLEVSTPSGPRTKSLPKPERVRLLFLERKLRVSHNIIVLNFARRVS
jgi:hypothetical protein